MKIPKFREKGNKQSSGLPPSRLKKSKNKQSSGLPPSRLKTKNKQSSGLPPSRRPRKPKKRIKPLSRWHPRLRQVTDWGVISASVLLCLFLLPNRFPGMELLGIGANWLLIWVVAWSIKRSAFQGAFAGIVLGLLQDGMTSPHPTHAISLGIVGFLIGLFQKQR
ncbi:MAG: rod shape-determining protein MreD, partial [Cyanobacteria bacterium J06636_27]